MLKPWNPGAGKENFWQGMLATDSPLRKADPRTKLLMSVFISLVVMLPLTSLLLFIPCYSLFLLWGRLLKPTLHQVWRVRWVLIVLFILDVWLVDLTLALTVSFRIMVLAAVFTLFFATTTPRELSLALEALKLPYRYAFSISLAVSSIGLLFEEWQAIREAQTARGVSLVVKGWRGLFAQMGQYVAFTVPAVVLTTRRAWNATEAAFARGFDSPHRQPYHTLAFKVLDYLLLAGCTAGVVILMMVN